MSLVYFNDNTGSPIGQDDMICKTVGLASMAVGILENKNAAYYTYIYFRP